MKRRDFSHIKTQTFRGKRYEIRWGGPWKDKDGDCDPPNKIQKRIRICPKDSETRSVMETAIHEALHACLWDLEEGAIDLTARDITTFLRRMGFRLD